MKRFLLSLLAGALVFGTVVGAAAALDVDAGVLQAGSDADLTCDDNGVGVGFSGFEGDAGLGTWKAVQLNGIDASCAGATVNVRIFNGPIEIWRGSLNNVVPVLSGSPTQLFNFSGGEFRNGYVGRLLNFINTEDITRVDVTFNKSGTGV